MPSGRADVLASSHPSKAGRPLWWVAGLSLSLLAVIAGVAWWATRPETYVAKSPDDTGPRVSSEAAELALDDLTTAVRGGDTSRCRRARGGRRRGVQCPADRDGRQRRPAPGRGLHPSLRRRGQRHLSGRHLDRRGGRDLGLRRVRRGAVAHRGAGDLPDRRRTPRTGPGSSRSAVATGVPRCGWPARCRCGVPRRRWCWSPATPSQLADYERVADGRDPLRDPGADVVAPARRGGGARRPRRTGGRPERRARRLRRDRRRDRTARRPADPRRPAAHLRQPRGLRPQQRAGRPRGDEPRGGPRRHPGAPEPGAEVAGGGFRRLRRAARDRPARVADRGADHRTGAEAGGARRSCRTPRPSTAPRRTSAPSTRLRGWLPWCWPSAAARRALVRFYDAAGDGGSLAEPLRAGFDWSERDLLRAWQQRLEALAG